MRRSRHQAGREDFAALKGAPPALAALMVERLGLKLESRKAPVVVLVIDHAERRRRISQHSLTIVAPIEVVHVGLLYDLDVARKERSAFTRV